MKRIDEYQTNLVHKYITKTESVPVTLITFEHKSFKFTVIVMYSTLCEYYHCEVILKNKVTSLGIVQIVLAEKFDKEKEPFLYMFAEAAINNYNQIT